MTTQVNFSQISLLHLVSLFDLGIAENPPPHDDNIERQDEQGTTNLSEMRNL